MDFKRNTFLLVLRLVFILLVMMAIPLATFFIEPEQLVFTYLVISLVLILLVTELVLYLNRTVRELTGFLEHIRNRDFSIRFNEEDTKGAKRKLYQTFNEVLKIYQDIRIEKEVQFRFLEHIIELIEVGIMVLDEHGKVVLMNTAAGNLIGVTSPGTWEQLKKKNPDFTASVDKIERTGRILFESGSDSMSSRLAIQINRTTMLDEPFTLLSFQDIRSEVEDKETGAWMRLMRILNHEIKNSVAPISSLADTILLILKHDDGSPKKLDELDAGNLSDVLTSVETLQQRSNGLHEFIEEYHKLTRIPAPNPQKINAASILEETAALFESDGKKSNIQIIANTCLSDLTIRADPGLIQQILINLITNSMEALDDRPEPSIHLSCDRTNEGITISIRDNGAGIEPGDLDNIFVPFYSTKPGGSGIGLSLTRQVMRLHGGNVRIASKKGEGTIVYLDFQG